MHPHSLADKAGKICWRNIQNILIFKNIICVFPSQNIMYSLWKAPNKQNIENQDHIDPTVWDSDDIAAKPGLLCAGSFLIGGVTKTGPTLPHYNGQQRGHAQL